MPYETVLVESADSLFKVGACAYQEPAAETVFVDSETTGLDPLSDRLILLQILARDTVFVINIAKIGDYASNPTAYEPLLKILEDKAIRKVGHNLKFDVKFLDRFFHPRKIQYRRLFDTYLAEELLTAGKPAPGGSALEDLARKYAGEEMDKSAQTSFTGAELTQEQVDYAANDVKVLPPILKEQLRTLTDEGLVDVARLEFSIIPSVAGIELSGIRLDLQRLQALKAKYEQKLVEVEAELNLIVHTLDLQKQMTLIGMGVNYSSPKQMKDVLLRMGFDVADTSTETLERIDHPFARDLLEYRGISKLLSSFIESLPKHVHQSTGRVHAEFFQLGAGSGRFSCREPNLQQIPREQEWRDLFVAEDGHKLVTADYSQIELRILAEYSRDPVFLEAYRKGEDLHAKTASAIFGVLPGEVSKEQRDVAKTINFGLCYGMGPMGLAVRLHIPEDKAKGFIDAYFRQYPGVRRCLQELGRLAVQRLYAETLSGRRRYFTFDDGQDRQDAKVLRAIERKGQNTPIQGTCGDIIKKALKYLAADLRPYDCRIVNVVHDEIVAEVKEEQVELVKPIIEKDMIRAAKDFLKLIPVEVDVSVCNEWKK